MIGSLRQYSSVEEVGVVNDENEIHQDQSDHT